MYYCKRRCSVLHAAALNFFVALTPGTTSAEVTWTFDSANCVSTVGPSGNCGSGDNNFSDGRTYQASGGGSDVSVSGWANAISSNLQLELGQITHYTGGLGVVNADGPRGQDTGEGSPPEHGIDNDQRFDLVLFDFGSQLVDLNQITLGWWQQDADISVLAYTGNLDPTDSSGADYIGDREAWWNSDTEKNEDLTTHGWSLIGNHDVDTTDPTNPTEFNPATADINPGDVASSYWLVSSYNPVFGSNCTPQNSFCQSDYQDYFQVLTLAGDIQPPEPPTPYPSLGVIGVEDQPLSLDTSTSSFNTELALFDTDGNLLHENDDGLPGSLSEIVLPDGLAVGRYLVALGGFDTVFGDGLSATPLQGSEGGSYTLNYTTGSIAGNLDPDVVDIFEFTIAPGPHNWGVDASGAWTGSLNWSPSGSAPVTAEDAAVFGDVTSAPRVVFTESPVTVNRIEFDHSETYVIAGFGSVNLAKGLASQQPGMETSIEVKQGTHEFQTIVNLEDNATVDVSSGSTLIFNNALNLNGNTLTKTGAGMAIINNVLHRGGGSIVALSGVISGSGAVGGDLDNVSSTVAPGSSVGILHVAGDYIQGLGATLEIEVSGTGAGEGGHDQLDVSGAAVLAGTLEVSLIDGYEPQAGDRFDILDFVSITGTFNQILWPDLTGGLFWDDSALLVDGSLSVVPEPSAAGLLLLGTLGAAACGRANRRERRQAEE